MVRRRFQRLALTRRAAAVLTSSLLGASLALGAGCASYRGAQLYVSGTRAIDQGETERAVSELERAAELVPHASEIQNHLGLAYASAGRSADAARAFERAVQLDCGNRAARANLALWDRAPTTNGWGEEATP